MLLTLASPQSDFAHLKGVAGIYAIVHLDGTLRGDDVDGYVGSAHCLATRLRSHVSVCGDSRHLGNAVKKYGADRFTIIILEYVDVMGLTRKEAQPRIIGREQWWIDRAGFDTLYNISPTAGSPLGVKHGPGHGSEGARAANASMTPEQRRERGRKAMTSLTPEQRRERARAATASLTPEQRRENYRALMTSLTPAQRRENARKATASLTPEQRRERGRKGARAATASLTPEQRRERGRNSAHTRWHTRKNIVNPSCSLCNADNR